MGTREVLLAGGVGVLLASLGWAQLTQRVSLATGGAEANFDCEYPVVSADGRFVAFDSAASNLVAGDTNGVEDVFVRDLWTGTTERVSVATGGGQGDGQSRNPAISADGRFVAFWSYATNLVAGDTNGVEDVFVHDRQTGTTERVSVATGGGQANSFSYDPAISADGRFVAFVSYATNLVAGDTNGYIDVFVHDRQSGTTERVSVATGGAEGNSYSDDVSISGDGRFVAFDSWASTLVAGDTNGYEDVFVHDLQSGTTDRVSVATGGAESDSTSQYPSISADGRFVAFRSLATNLVAGDTNMDIDVFVRDLQSGTTVRASLTDAGGEANDDSNHPWISVDGRFVAFRSYASNLVAGDTNHAADIFLRDLQAGTTERVSVDSSGGQGDYESDSPSISADGRLVAFSSWAGNLVAGDTNGNEDVFVRDRDATGFTSLCDPGVGGVIACPCANPASGPGRGCDNSSATGGASLAAAGVAYLSSDSLVFTTAGERPTATSILLQGNALVGSGMVYGQGVRCTGGVLKRLYTKTASGGSITAPDFSGGDPTVSARSAAKGDTIQAGESRWYLVYYRDPTVLGGCPASSTFNATQSGRIDWSL